MITVMLLSPLFFIVRNIFNAIDLDKLVDLPFGIGDTINLMSKALMFFPLDVWVVVLMNITAWLSIQFAWAIIEWIYRKIPGIN